MFPSWVVAPTSLAGTGQLDRSDATSPAETPLSQSIASKVARRQHVEKSTTPATVVFLHPLGADKSFWDPVLEELAVDTSVVAIDLPGHGGAPCLGRGATLGEWAEAVHLRLPVDTDLIVVGLSLGGLVAQQLAATFSNVIGAVLVDTVVRYPADVREMWTARARDSRRSGTAQFVETTLTTWFSAACRSADGQPVRSARRTLEQTAAEGYARACELLADVNTEAVLPRITCPTLVVCGSEDSPAFVSAARQLNGSISGSRIAWLPGRHAAAVEHPSIFVAALEFLIQRCSRDKETE